MGLLSALGLNPPRILATAGAPADRGALPNAAERQAASGSADVPSAALAKNQAAFRAVRAVLQKHLDDLHAHTHAESIATQIRQVNATLIEADRLGAKRDWVQAAKRLTEARAACAGAKSIADGRTTLASSNAIHQGKGEPSSQSGATLQNQRSTASSDSPASHVILPPSDRSAAKGKHHPEAKVAQTKSAGQSESMGSKGVLLFDFAPGESTLTTIHESALANYQINFSSRGNRIEITGHSSSDEDSAVSQKRADAVATFLRSAKQHPVPEGNIILAIGVGAAHPLAVEGPKGGPNESKRRRNRCVEIKRITAEKFLEGEIDVDATGVGKDAPKSGESNAVGYAEIITDIVSKVFEEGAVGFAAEFAAPFAMMLEVALSQEEARAAQQRIAFSDGMAKCADAARDFISHHHASVGYGDVETASMPRIDDMAYFPADAQEAKFAASTGIKAGVDAFNPAMRKTEQFVRARLKDKGLSGSQHQTVYDKLIDDVRARVAYALADAIKEESRRIRKG